jgi:microcystin-dependent protein
MTWATGQTIQLADFRGFIQPYAGTAAPTGWLLCDGSAVSRTTYADLFTLIGITYGAGDGTTTFNVPNLKGRFPLGYAASAATKVFTFSSRSSNTITITGADNHAHSELQTGQAVVYNTTGSVITGLSNAATYYLIRIAHNQFQLATTRANANAGTAITLSSNGSGTQTFTITYTARPLGQTGGEEVHSLTDAQMPSHLHDIPVTDGAASGTITITPGNETPATTLPTNVTGSDEAHNVMPLFTVINYIIKH